MKTKKIKEWTPRARKAAKAYGVRALAEKIGCAYTYLSQVSRSDVRTTEAMAAALSAELGIPASEFGQIAKMKAGKK